MDPNLSYDGLVTCVWQGFCNGPDKSSVFGRGFIANPLKNACVVHIVQEESHQYLCLAADSSTASEDKSSAKPL